MQGSAGDYEDHREWIVGFHEDKEIADAWSRTLNVGDKSANDLLAEIDFDDDKYMSAGEVLVKQMRKYDPAYEEYTSYDVIELTELPTKAPTIKLEV